MSETRTKWTKGYALPVDGDHIIFDGEVIGISASKKGDPSPWIHNILYRATNNKYVCWSVQAEAGPEFDLSTRWRICENLDEVREFFGEGVLARELYRDAEVED